MYKLIAEYDELLFERRLNELGQKGYECVKFQAFLSKEGRERFVAIMYKKN